MPRLHGVREREPFNVWDLIEVERERMLFMRMGGRPSHVSNLNGSVNSDKTMLVTGWYVRTTMPPGPERDRAFHNAVATLVVGERPMRQLSLAELALRDETSEIEQTNADRVESVGNLAQAMYLEYERHTPPGHPVAVNPTYKTWGDLSPIDKNRWVAAADAAMRIVKPRPHVIVPVRQSWRVIVENYPPAAQALHKTWVHVVGFTVRDVC